MMSLDKDTVVTHEGPLRLSPSFTAGSLPLPQQPQLTKVQPLYPKFGLQQPNNGQPPPSSSPPPLQRIGKRRYTVGVGFKGLAKRRRRTHSESQADPVLPSHFLLGGNIFDPLNLNSLLNEEVSRSTNQETPKCSPLPSRCRDPVEILVPRDITDPLNLKGGSGDGEEEGGVLLSPLKSRRRHRNRHRGGEGEKEVIPARLFTSTAPFSVPLLTREGSVAASPLPCELNTAITCRDDVAPPPVLPRRNTHPPPGHIHKSVSHGENRQRRRRRTTSSRLTDAAVATVPSAPVNQTTKFQTPLMGEEKAGRCVGSQSSNQQPVKMKKNKLRYQYGNHSHYYGYHGFYGDNSEGRVGSEQDGRLRLLQADWFRDKTVLDVGCGVGHVALAIARKFNPAHIIGVELDKHLVHAAKQNVRHFLSHDLVVNERARRRVENRDEENKEDKEEKEEVMEKLHRALSLRSFPMSFRVSRGPLSAPPLTPVASSSCSSFSRFPNNITFIQGDYMSKQETWPGQGQYDVIICLNVTKWVHLQSGDGGVVTLFKRVYQSLPLGGLFILEPQPWSSYSHSKRASEGTRRHYRSLKLKPEQFTSFLTDTVGFSSYRLLTHSGNRRPIYMFHKGPVQRK